MLFEFCDCRWQRFGNIFSQFIKIGANWFHSSVSSFFAYFNLSAGQQKILPDSHWLPGMVFCAISGCTAGKNLQIQEVLMKTGLTKRQKRTSICFTGSRRVCRNLYLQHRLQKEACGLCREISHRMPLTGRRRQRLQDLWSPKGSFWRRRIVRSENRRRVRWRREIQRIWEEG